MDHDERNAEIARANSMARTADSTRNRSRGFQAGMTIYTIPFLTDEQTESGQCVRLRDQVIREIKRVVPQDQLWIDDNADGYTAEIFVGLFEPQSKLEQIIDRSDNRWKVKDGDKWVQLLGKFEELIPDLTAGEDASG